MLQEREKRRIVIASILKPTNDTRMAEKMGGSLARAGHAVTIVGYAAPGSVPPSIKSLPIGPFSRLSLNRWWARWRVFRLAFATRPDVFIFGTYELIFPALWLKILLGTRIVYDVRENYYRNIRHSEGLNWFVRLPLAMIVRFIEKLTAPAIDHFFLAEQGYDKEFKFHRGGWTVLENKAIARTHPVRIRSGSEIHLLFSGTLSESTGVFRAIRLVEKLHGVNNAVRLTVAGYAATGSVRQRLQREAGKHPFVKCIGVDSLVPHDEIAALIDRCHGGIIAYLPAPHILNAVPTKLFEYLQASLPILAESHWPWVKRYASCEPFVPVSFESPDAQSILNMLINKSLYTTPVPDVDWSSEEGKLLEAIKNIV